VSKTLENVVVFFIKPPLRQTVHQLPIKCVPLPEVRIQKTHTYISPTSPLI